MPVYGIGTWKMGGGFNRGNGEGDQRDIATIREAIRRGVTHIDTAEIYAAGRAEELVGKAIKDLDRSELFMVSKVTSEHLKYERVIKSCKASLERLGTSYLNLYLIHVPNPEISIEETMQAMDTLKEEGLIKEIGISNFSSARTAEALAATRYNVVATQVHLNLMYREPEQEGLLKYCQENDIMLIAWRPVEKGILTMKGKFPILDEICEKYGKTPAQVAINWLISQPNVVTLSKTSNIEHLDENLGALGWQMEDEDVEKLRKEFPDQREVSDSVPLI